MNILAPLTASLTSVPSQRRFLSFLRKYLPVPSVAGKTIVARHADVVEVLSRDNDFLIAPINAPKLDALHLHFLLAMDASEEHSREFALLKSIGRREDTDRIRQLIREQADACIRAALPAGRLEVVHDFNLPVINYLLDRYFGVLDGVTAPREIDGWMRLLFWQSFLNLANGKTVEQKALAASRRLESYLLQLIAQKRAANTTPGDTLLERLIAAAGQPGSAWITADVIRRQISGLMIGAVDTTSKCVVNVLDELFRRPEQLQQAIEAARRNDIMKITMFCWEALRFNPHNPLIMRYCKADTTVGGEGQKKHRIKEGNIVFASTLSAMFDESVFTDPDEFRTNRTTPYLHFGAGVHQCYGRHINAVTIPEMTAAILRLPGLRRTDGEKGEVVYDGPFPDAFELQYTPRNPANAV